MIPDLEERIRRIVEGYGGDQHAPPADEGLDLAGIRALGQTMTPGQGEDLPKGTKVNFAEPELAIAAPPSRMPLQQPKVVQVPTSAQLSPDAMDSAYAKAQDNRAQQKMAYERGGRELVAGITRTAPQPVINRPTDAFAKQMAAQKDKAARAQAQGKIDFDTKEAARKAAIDQQRYDQGLKEKTLDNDRAERGLKIGADNAAATRDLARAGFGIKKEEHETKMEDRADKDAAGAIPLMGGTLTLTQGLSDTERGKARSDAASWNAADEAVGEFQRVLEDFARHPSLETKGRVTAALRTASAAFNAAIGGGAMAESEARAMSDAMGADVLNPSGLQAMAESLLGSDDTAAAATISNRVRAARQANRATALGRLKTYGAFSDGKSRAPGAPQRQIVKNPKTGERRYLNADGSLGEAVK